MGTEVKIMQGVPGSGKSSWVRAQIALSGMGVLAATTENSPVARMVVSADDHFMTPDGQYNFNPAGLAEAQATCFYRAISWFQSTQGSGEDRVLYVDNTNTTHVEIAPYVQLANAYNATHTICTMWCDPAVAGERNTHGVPMNRILKMHAAILESIRTMPPWWNHRILIP